MDRRKQIKWFKENIDIREYLLFKGYKIDKSRDSARFRAFISADGNEKLVVPINDRYPVPSFYFNQHDPADKGSIIDFVASRENKDLGEVCETLQAFNPQGGLLSGMEGVATAKTVADRKETHQYVIDRIMAHPVLNNTSYLLSRAIAPEVLEDPIFQGRVFSHSYQGEALIAYPFHDVNNVARGLWMKNEQTRRFLGQREQSLWLSNRPEGQAERLIINESPEESLAHRNLKYHVKEVGADFYVAIGGHITDAQVGFIQTLVEDIKPFTVVVAMNNDGAGDRYKSKLVQSLQVDNLEVESPQFNDFNCDLLAVKRYTSEDMHLLQGQEPPVTMPFAMKQAFNKGDVLALSRMLAEDPRLIESQGVYTLDQRLYVFSMEQIAQINQKSKVIQWVAQLKA